MTNARSNERQQVAELLEIRRNDPSNFVFDAMFPQVTVTKRFGKYATVSGMAHNASLDFDEAIREVGGEFPSVGIARSNTNLHALKRIGVKAKVDEDDASDSAEDGVDEDEAAAIRADHALRIIKEQKAKALYDTVSSTTVGASSRWDDDGIDPRDLSLAVLDDFRAKAIGGLDPRYVKCFIYPSVWRVACRQNFVLSNHRFGDLSAPQKMNEQQFADFLQVGEVIVPYAVHNTAALGLSESNSFVFSEAKVIFAYLPPSNTRLAVNSAAANFVKAGQGLQVRTEDRKMNFEREVLVTEMLDPRIVDENLIAAYDTVIG